MTNLTKTQKEIAALAGVIIVLGTLFNVFASTNNAKSETEKGTDNIRQALQKLDDAEQQETIRRIQKSLAE